MGKYDDIGETDKAHLPAQTKRWYLITHDERTFNVNNSLTCSWEKAGCEWLKPKSRGRGIMVSVIFCAAIGRLSYIPPADHDGHELAECIYATEIIRYVLPQPPTLIHGPMIAFRYGSSKGKDEWWNAEKMVEQNSNIQQRIFQRHCSFCLR